MILAIVISTVSAATVGAAIAWIVAERKARTTADELREQLSAEKIQSATLAANLAASEKNVEEQKAILNEAHQKFTDAFASVSQNTLTRSNEIFLQMAEARFKTLAAESVGSLDERKAQITTLLKPLEEMLASYQKRLAEIESSRTNAYGELLKNIGSMTTTQEMLSKQTTQLVSALKKSNVRGQWGEIALQRLAEIAGMTEHIDFDQQESLRTDDGKILRPDMIVRLPGGGGNRSVPVDAKAVMNAFLDAMSATDDSARLNFMQAHARNVRSRIDDLSSKTYWEQFDSPEFVVLFLPGESFLYAACDCDPGLIEYAINKRVLIATPTTLIGLLQTIKHSWRQQLISENAEVIRTLGKEIFERLAGMTEHLSKLGSTLNNAVEHYNKTIGTMESRVLVSARRMSELGVQANKELPILDPIDKRTRSQKNDDGVHALACPPSPPEHAKA
ncbi:MAG: DNA recombination protein RmuC [Phycisphaerales bacterium]|nr:DNA recombination protein RmuC [Phycisphaerales bacterium]